MNLGHGESLSMPTIDLKTSHKAVKDYYAGLEEFRSLGDKYETTMRAAFQWLLERYSRKVGWTL